jgi:methionine-rich copper-binding protein CopC
MKIAPAVMVFCSLALAPSAFAQAKSSAPKPAAKTAAAPAPAAPAAPAKFVRPIKGEASIELIQTPSKRVGADMVTVLKVKNTSSGAIALLKIDEYWYDRKMQVVSGDSQAWRKLFNPGDVIEITMRSPVKPDLYKSQYAFSHANGKIVVKGVKKFD